MQYYLDLSSPYIKMGEEEEGGGGDPALDADGYLRMSSASDYTPMSPTSTTSPSAGPPLATMEEEDDLGPGGDRPHYINQRSFPREKGSDIEMQPLIDSSGGGAGSSSSSSGRGGGGGRRSSIPDEVAPGFVAPAAPTTTTTTTTKDGSSPGQVRTLAEVHHPDDSDSGHSSSYAPGTSPTDNSGYLLPKAYEAAAGGDDAPPSAGGQSKSLGTAEGGSEEGERGGGEKKGVVARDSAFSSTSPDYHLNSYPPPDYRLVVEEGAQRDLPV